MSLIEDAKFLRRPKVLVRAARFAMLDFRREKSLRRVLRREKIPGPMAAIALLMHRERELETMRTQGDAAYSVSKHIDVLAALMGELSVMGPALKKSCPERVTTHTDSAAGRLVSM